MTIPRFGVRMCIALLLLTMIAAGCASPVNGMASAATTTTTTAPSTTAPPPTASLNLFDISPVVEQVQGGIVSVTQDQVLTDFFGRTQEVPVGAGTGVVVDANGLILTNYHVIKGASSITVTAHDGSSRPATIVYRAPNRDLALLKVDDASDLTPLPLGDSDAIKVGQPAIAIGNALALNAQEPTVSLGIISALHRRVQTEQGFIDDAIQTDAAINPGNSGGPLLNGAGQVIGINTAIAGGFAQNVGFAIPINGAKQLLERFRKGVGEPYLGVVMVDNNPTAAQKLHISVDKGALITQVASGSPADTAGLVQYDVIVEIAGKKIDTVQDVIAAVNATDPGDTVEVVYVRGTQRRTVQITIGSRPDVG